MAEQHIIPETFRVKYRNDHEKGWVNDKYVYLGNPFKMGFLTTRAEGNDMKNWLSWGDKDSPVDTFPNFPRAGYMIHNTTKRDADWFGSGRHVWRIWHHEGFVFEITTENMQAILAITTVTQNEIMEECILAWQGQRLALIPCNSELYIKAKQDTLIRSSEAIAIHDLRPGDRVTSDKGDNYWYIGSWPRIKVTEMKERNRFVRYNSTDRIRFDMIKPEPIFLIKDKGYESRTTIKPVQVTGHDPLPEFDKLQQIASRYDRIIAKEKKSPWSIRIEDATREPYHPIWRDPRNKGYGPLPEGEPPYRTLEVSNSIWRLIKENQFEYNRLINIEVKSTDDPKTWVDRYQDLIISVDGTEFSYGQRRFK